MAFNAFSEDTGVEDFSGGSTSEEQRKKRLAMFAGMGGGANFADMASQYLGNRMNQAEQTVQNAGQMFGVQPQPVAPVMPQPQVAQPTTQPAMQPTMVQKPVTPEEVQQTQLPQPGPGVQVAGTQPGMGVNEAANAAQPQVQTTVQPQVQPTSWTEQVSKIANDERGLAQYISNPDNSPEGIKFAKERLQQLWTQAKDTRKAEAMAQEAIASNNLLPLMKEIKKSGEEGSHIKAYLYARLGLTDLAKEEQQKLGAGATYAGAIGPNGERALIKYNADGLPMKGFNEKGQELSPEQLSTFAASAITPQTKSFTLPAVHGTPVQRTNDQGQVETGLIMYDPRTQQSYVQVGNQRLPTTGWTTMSQTPQSVYGAAGAGQQGKQAAQTGVQQPAMPPMAGVPQAQPAMQAQPQVAPAAMPEAQPQTRPQAQPTKPAVVAQASPTGGVKLAPQRTAGGGQVITQQPGESYEAYQQRKKASEEQTQANIQLGKELELAGKGERAKVAGQTIDAKLNQLNEIQDVAQRGLDAINNGKHLFGGGTNAISRGYYKVNPLATESDEYRVTKDVMALTQKENLSNLASMLKGSFSDKDLAYVNKNMINENSSPAQIKRWLEHYERAARKAYEQQASSVNVPGGASPSAPTMPTTRVRKYNPATGKVE